MLVVVGVLYFGRIMNYTIDETHLANIAARYAAVDSNPACPNNDPTSGTCTMTLANYVKSQADPGELQTQASTSDPSTVVKTPVKICISTPSGSSGTAGGPVQATVTSTFQVIPFMNLISIPVSETATMMLEDNPAPQLLSCSS